MKYLLLLLPLLLSTPVNAQVDPEIHKLCSDVKDYAGCVQTQMSLGSKRKTNSTPSVSKESEELTPWQKYLNENPNLKAWVEANPSLSKNKKEEWKKTYFNCDHWMPPGNQTCLEFAKEGLKYTYDSADTPKLERERQACFKDSSRMWMKDGTCIKRAPLAEVLGIKVRSPGSSMGCPPGKRIYQKTALFGLIKGAKLCLSDYEAESLRQAQVQNTITNMNQTRIINCTSNTFGNYMSTTCY